MNRLDSVRDMVSNTPLLEIDLTYCGKPMKIYAKAEYYNLTGSIKDRVAYYILRKAAETGTLKPGDVIAKTGASTMGVVFAALAMVAGAVVTLEAKRKSNR